MATKNDGFFSGLSIADVFNGYVKLESAKVNARMSDTAPQQDAGLNATGRTQNVQARAGAVAAVPGRTLGMTGKQIGIGFAGLGLLLAVLKIARVI